jgi:hypothetical protein
MLLQAPSFAVDPADVERHVVGLSKEPIIYIAAVELAVILALFTTLVATLFWAVQQGRAFQKEAEARADAERERAEALTKAQFELEHILRAFVGSVKAGIWELKKFRDAAKLRPQPLPEDPEKDETKEVLQAMEAQTASHRKP